MAGSSGISISDLYGGATLATGGGSMGAPVQGQTVQEVGQGVTHLSMIAWASMIGALVLIRVLWELSE